MLVAGPEGAENLPEKVLRLIQILSATLSLTKITTASQDPFPLRAQRNVFRRRDVRPQQRWVARGDRHWQFSPSSNRLCGILSDDFPVFHRCVSY